MHKSIIVGIFIFFLITSSVFSQVFENSGSLIGNFGYSLPSGPVNDSYNPGPTVSVIYRGSLGPTTTIGVKGGLVIPSSDSDGYEFYQIPFRILLYFPMAGEAASSPYFALGPGLTYNNEEFKHPITLESKSTSHTYVAYTLTLGYALRPESMGTTMFDFAVSYEQQFVNDGRDLRNFDFTFGIGLCF